MNSFIFFSKGTFSPFTLKIAKLSKPPFCKLFTWVTEENKVQLAVLDADDIHSETYLGFGQSQKHCCKLCLLVALLLSLSFSLPPSRCPSALWSIILIVLEIYSEISLLTPSALELNEWSVKLMGQIQSFLVTHFTPHAHPHTHMCSLASAHISVSLSLTMQNNIRLWSQLYEP